MPRFRGGWRTGVSFGVLGVLIILLANISVLIAVTKTSEIQNGAAVIYEGSCETKTKFSIWSHAIINLCSTLLLSASNNAMQCLAAPSRHDIDQVHKRGIWLDIGIPSLRNLTYVGWKRLILWTILLLSSVPLHLLYNSVIPTSISANDYMEILTTDNFTLGADFDQTFSTSQIEAGWGGNDTNEQLTALGPPINYTEISIMQSNWQDLIQLDNVDCSKTYNSDLISKWRNVLLVSNATEDSSIINIFSHKMSMLDTMPWLCGSQLTLNVSNPKCTQQQLSNEFWPMDYPKASMVGEAKLCNDSSGVSCQSGSQDPDWSARNTTSSTNADQYLNKSTSDTEKYYAFPVQNPATAFIQYCLAQPAVEHCKVTFHVQLMLIVIVCNVLKGVSLLLLLLLPDFAPIVTIGDAISSFLERQDPYTVRHRLAPVSSNLKPQDWFATEWKLRRHRWFSGATVRQWYPGYLSLGVIWFGSLVLLCQSYGVLGSPRYSLAELWSFGFGSVHAPFVGASGTSFTWGAVLVNTPQLFASIGYLTFNLLITSMAMTAECNDFAVHRKSLRVSAPRGQQRSTYYLQLPYRCAIPLMLISSALHLLISQSFFLVNILVINTGGFREPDEDVIACGWSPIALICTVIFIGLMFISLLLVGGCRRYSMEMPIMRSKSLHISAACHPPVAEADAALGPVGFGVMNEGPLGKWRAAFTGSTHTVPLSSKVPNEGGYCSLETALGYSDAASMNKYTSAQEHVGHNTTNEHIRILTPTSPVTKG